MRSGLWRWLSPVESGRRYDHWGGGFGGGGLVARVVASVAEGSAGLVAAASVAGRGW
jgi:hypothetical protein